MEERHKLKLTASLGARAQDWLLGITAHLPPAILPIISAAVVPVAPVAQRVQNGRSPAARADAPKDGQPEPRESGELIGEHVHEPADVAGAAGTAACPDSQDSQDSLLAMWSAGPLDDEHKAAALGAGPHNDAAAVGSVGSVQLRDRK